MSQRKTLGANIGPGAGAGRAGGMMAAFGFAAPPSSESPPSPPAPPAPEPEAPAPSPPRRRAIPAAPREASPVLSRPPEGATAPAIARIGTDIAAESLALAKRAAYWNRETLRSFLENAIEAAARRIADEHGLASLPETPGLRRGRPRRL